MDCLFCKIISGEIPSNKLYEDDTCYAFHDINPEAPVHFLVIPKTHMQDVGAADPATAGHCLTVAARLAKEQGLADGYRIVTNCGRDGGQTVGHLHFHVLGGRALGWPPG